MSIFGKSRMINIDLLKTSSFLDLPLDSKLLYIFIICEADDDGAVNVEPILRYLNISIDALNILQIKNFILPLGNGKFKVPDSIFFIKDFHLHNTIPANKKKDSLYKPVIEKLYPEEAKFLIESAHKDRRISTNYFDINEDDFEVIEEENNNIFLDDNDGEGTYENIENLNLEVKNSGAKLNQTKLNQTKLNHHHQDIDRVQNKIEEDEENKYLSIKLEVGKPFYGKYENLILTDNDVKIINNWNYPNMVVDIASELVKNNLYKYPPVFKVLEDVAKENNWYNYEIHYFGRQRNLILNNEDYTFFNEKYVDADKHLKKVADKTIKINIRNPFSYIETIAQNEVWKEKEEVEAAEAKKKQNRLKLEAEEKALKEQEERAYRMKLIDKYNLPVNASEEMLKKAEEKEQQEVLLRMKEFINKKEIT